MKLSPNLDVLVDWFSLTASSAIGLSMQDTGQLLLCAKDLNVTGYHLSRRLEEVTQQEDPLHRQKQHIIQSFLRQIVLFQYECNIDERKNFLEYWLTKQHRSELDPVSRSYLIGLSLEQIDLVPAAYQAYVRKWFVRNKLRSDRVRGWRPHYLSLSGKRKKELARESATRILSEREKNGSWRGGQEVTLGILYALIYSGIVECSELAPTINYVSRRYDNSRTGSDGVDALALKTFYRLGLLVDENRRKIEDELKRSSTVFLSHCSKDKPFVRRLADDLTSWNVWLDEREIKVGDSIVDKIQGALKDAGYIIIVLSKQSVGSRWVQKEINTGLMTMLDSNRVRLLPVLAEDCPVPLLLSDIRYADFRDSYDNGLRELINGLDAAAN